MYSTEYFFKYVQNIYIYAMHLLYHEVNKELALWMYFIPHFYDLCVAEYLDSW